MKRFIYYGNDEVKLKNNHKNFLKLRKLNGYKWKQNFKKIPFLLT